MLLVVQFLACAVVKVGPMCNQCEKLRIENERLRSELSIADLKTHKEKTLRILALLNECDTLKAKLAEVEAELDNKRGAMMLEIKRLHELADREREAAKVMREALEQIQSLAANEHEQGDSKALDDVLDLTCETFKALAKADEIRGGE